MDKTMKSVALKVWADSYKPPEITIHCEAYWRSIILGFLGKNEYIPMPNTEGFATWFAAFNEMAKNARNLEESTKDIAHFDLQIDLLKSLSNEDMTELRTIIDSMSGGLPLTLSAGYSQAPEMRLRNPGDSRLNEFVIKATQGDSHSVTISYEG